MGVTTAHRIRRLPVVALLLAASTTCRSSPADTSTSTGTPLSICDAGRAPVGATVLVRGEFDGFRQDTNPRRATLVSRELCPGRGVGGVVANLANTTEAEKLSQVQSRDELRRIPGAVVTISGRISEIDDGRLVILDDAVVRQVKRWPLVTP
jgi:hypothetical protein